MDTLAMLLEFQGYDVYGAGNGFDAVQLITDIRPQAAILDRCMPGMSGYDVAKTVRALFPDTVLISFSAAAQQGDVKQSERAAFDFHFWKAGDLAPLFRQLKASTCEEVTARQGPPA